MEALAQFHPITSTWFTQTFGQPTPAQQQAWPAIKQGKHTLIAAPTGSGKTLAAFYSAIDELLQQSIAGTLPDQTQVVYISPLKALSNDIHRNLQVPLAGIEAELKKQGLPAADIRVAVRTGDTPQSERQSMLKRPPHILVTTPESFYLLLTSMGGRKMLGNTKTIIIDEIHAVLGDKRGSHLSLSVERLQALTQQPLQRIGLSATQKPINLVANFLTGSPSLTLPTGERTICLSPPLGGDQEGGCHIVDSGLRKDLNISIEVPGSPLSSVMENEVWGELYNRIEELVEQHKTTLIFVNTRRLAERLAVALAEKIGDGHVTSHHGSMSTEHRHQAEQKLKAGNLKVLVATASMEMGIDIGSVELVIQIASPKSIAAFVQRVGRSSHYVGGTPKGIMFPLTLDELVESVAVFDSIRRGELDAIVMPIAPVDILCQQIVAEVANADWEVDALFDLFTNAYPYKDLTKEEFQNILQMMAEGYSTRRGRRGSLIHYDAVNGIIRGRKGSRLLALTNGGSIPDMFDYDVVLEPENIKVGSVNEDWALESLPGDTFTLGTHTWQILGVEGLKLKVKDATGMPPSIPFWLGEGPGRTKELSESVSRLKTTIGEMLDKDPLPRMKEKGNIDIVENTAFRWLVDELEISEPAAEQLVYFLYSGKVGLGVMPTRETIVLERFFDDTGDMHLVVHSPFGSRVNRGWGLSLRKKFCQSFNFELQAAANEDAIILSLSSSHSFPLEGVYNYLNTKILRDTLIQAMLDAPMFEVRWRWNATRSLAIQRNRNGKRVPPQFQRMNAEDFVAQVFPDQIACFENIDGEREVPDHPLVNQAIHDCLTEAMDIDELEELIGKIERKELRLEAKDLREPSAFSQGIINARPYAFLDETEFAERRVNAIRNRSWLDPTETTDLSKLDKEAIERVKQEAWPTANSVDELHDVLNIYGFLTPQEIKQNAWQPYLDELIANKRATNFCPPPEGAQGGAVAIATERIHQFKALFPEATFEEIQLPENLRNKEWTFEDALKEITRGRMEALASVTVARLAKDIGLPESKIEMSLLALETEGFVFRGKFEQGIEEEQWCERRLLQRMHKYTIDSLRKSIQPVSQQDYMRFLFSHHKVREEDSNTGPDSLQKTLDMLEGFEASAAAWETDIIPSRIANYDPNWLDVLCMSGRLVWGRYNQPKNSTGKSGPIKTTPICLVPRQNNELWRTMAYHNKQERELSSNTQLVLADLEKNGASFFDDIVSRTKLLKTQVENGVGELVANGLLSSDSYTGLRALLTPAYNKPKEGRTRRSKREATFGIEHAGRWTLIPEWEGSEKKKLDFELLEQLVFIYLKRWGVIFRTILEKEPFAPPWRILVRVLRRLELRGELRGGRFITGVSGEQFALPETINRLRKVRNEEKTGELIAISAADPLNLLGVIMPGKKITHHTNNRILFEDGIPIAVIEGKDIKWLKQLSEEKQWEAQKVLVQRTFPPKLRAYLGKSYK